MEHLFGSSHAVQLSALFLALALALGFECVNGFHDTANAVATVIYTHSLPPWVAVIWSGIWNFIGVLTSSGAVAFAVVSLLPIELVSDVVSAPGFAMLYSLLISALLWNLGTWYLGLPVSSTHSLIGSIMGVGLMNSLLKSGSLMGGVNWGNAKGVGLSLMISPLVGFGCTALLFLLLKALVHKPDLYSPADAKKPPPLWIRSILCLTCTGVSFAHGSNDGQKGLGIMMLILVGIVPGIYAINLSPKAESIGQLRMLSQNAAVILKSHDGNALLETNGAAGALQAYLKPGGVFSNAVYTAVASKNEQIVDTLGHYKSMDQLPEDQRNALRTAIYLTSESIAKLSKEGKFSGSDASTMEKYKAALDQTTRFIPVWVKFSVALALGVGTMIGWKRVVVTVGERIGKTHLTYAQGASAERVTMITIVLATEFGLPVSTTHVLSSGVAGAMAANRSGLQSGTLRNLLLAWVLTLPACVFLGASLFAGILLLITHVLGLH
jgi:PiT family inorganic phosphate transporter